VRWSAAASVFPAAAAATVGWRLLSPPPPAAAESDSDPQVNDRVTTDLYLRWITQKAFARTALCRFFPLPPAQRE